MDLNVYTETDAVKAVQDVKQDPAAPGEIAAPGKETRSGDTLTRDDVYARVLKYVPAPLIGIYLMATNLVVAQADNGETPNEILLWIILVVFLAATVAYLVVRHVQRMFQIAMSVIAFLAFAAASPGPFQQISGWDEIWGTLALLGAALLLVVFQPGPIPEE